MKKESSTPTDPAATREALQTLVRAEAEFWADPNLTYVYGEEDPPEGPGPFLCHDEAKERRYTFAAAVLNTVGVQWSAFDNAPDEVQDCVNWPEQSAGLQTPEDITTEVVAALMNWMDTERDTEAAR